MKFAKKDFNKDKSLYNIVLYMAKYGNTSNPVKESGDKVLQS